MRTLNASCSSQKLLGATSRRNAGSSTAYVHDAASPAVPDPHSTGAGHLVSCTIAQGQQGSCRPSLMPVVMHEQTGSEHAGPPHAPNKSPFHGSFRGGIGDGFGTISFLPLGCSAGAGSGFGTGAGLGVGFGFISFLPLSARVAPLGPWSPLLSQLRALVRVPVSTAALAPSERTRSIAITAKACDRHVHAREQLHIRHLHPASAHKQRRSAPCR